MEGQTDIYDALHETEREDGVPGPKEERRPPAEHRTLSASEVVALRLKGKQ